MVVTSNITSKFDNGIAFTGEYTIITAVITKTINAHNFIKFYALANCHVNFPYPVTGHLYHSIVLVSSLCALQ